MRPIETYFNEIQKMMSRVLAEESDNIHQAALVLADQVEQGKLIHVFGTGGHSYMAGEEMFYRAGGLQLINAILDPGVSLGSGARRTTLIERTPGYAKAVLDAYGVSSGDVLILVNVNGINALTIDTAEECKKRGVTVIGVTSKEFSLQVPPGTPSRHPSNKNLFEVADIVLDLKVPAGDAILNLPGLEVKVAASSTVMVGFVLNSLSAETIQILLDRGIKPPVWFSANLPGGDEYNKKFIEKNISRIKHL